MNSIWNKNIEAFSKGFPQLSELYKNLIASISESENPSNFKFWNVTAAKNGIPTASIQTPEGNRIQLHSSYNPEREASGSISKILETKKSTIVFSGFGLGYHVNELAKLLIQKKDDISSVKKIILVEPDPLHFFAAMFYTDWTPLFQCQNQCLDQLILAVSCPPETLISLLDNGSLISLENNGISDCHFFTIAAFTAHNKPYFETIQTLIERNLRKNQINSATFEKFAKRWIKNSIANIPQIQKCRTVQQFIQQQKDNQDFLKQQNYVVAAAGPSLQKNLAYLKEIWENKLATIICVETALHALLKNDIQPDFIVLTDPQYYAYRHIAALEAPESILVVPISVYPAVFRFKCKEIVLCSDLFPISKFFEKRYGCFGDLGAGGSVASSAWNLAYLSGAKNIYFAGLDLSYPQKETHIKGSSAEQTFHTKSSKTTSADKFSCGSMYSAYPEYGINYNGDRVLTDSRMKMFAWWFESRIEACPDVKNWSLSSSSLKIPGVEYKKCIEDSDLKTVYSVPVVRSPAENTKTSVTSDQFTLINNQFIQAVTELKKLINSAVEKCIIYSAESENIIEKELTSINLALKENPLYDFVLMAKPSKKDYSPLELYTRIQQFLNLF